MGLFLRFGAALNRVPTYPNPTQICGVRVPANSVSDRLLNSISLRRKIMDSWTEQTTFVHRFCK
jgi:hypothetical protein